MHPNVARVFCVLSLLVASCGQAQQSRPAQSAAPDAAPKLVLHGYDIVQMRLTRPATVPVAPDKSRQFGSAYLVRLKIDKPPTMGPALEIFIGDYRVPEYGGLRDGIYFKIYDPEQLRKLAGGEIKYRQPPWPVQSFGRKLEVPEVSKIPVVNESDVFPNRK